MLRRSSRILIGVGLAVSLLWGYCLFHGARNLSVAEQALAEGNEERAVEFLRRSAQWNCPLNPYSGGAAQRLVLLAESAVSEGREGDGLAAYRQLRYAALTSRSIYTPHMDELISADQAIADLTAEARKHEPEAILAALRAATGRAPNPAISFVVFLSLIGWLSSAGLTLSEVAGSTRQSQQSLVVRVAPRLFLFLGSFVVWLWSLSVA